MSPENIGSMDQRLLSACNAGLAFAQFPTTRIAYSMCSIWRSIGQPFGGESIMSPTLQILSAIFTSAASADRWAACSICNSLRHCSWGGTLINVRLLQ